MDLVLSKSILLAEKLSLNPSNQFTRRIDKLAEDITIKEIEKSGINTYLISEEIGEVVIGKGEIEIFIVLDPVDGTRNAVNGIPFFSSSIALGKYKDNISINDVDIGYVRDIYNGNSFWALKGEGAFENNNKLETFNKTDLENSLVSIYAYRNLNAIEKYQKLALNAKIRTLGSQALELCYVASGKLDACIDLRGISRVVDTAAAKLILEESGGIFYILDQKDQKMSLKNAKGFSFIATPNERFLKGLIEFLDNQN